MVDWSFLSLYIIFRISARNMFNKTKILEVIQTVERSIRSQCDFTHSFIDNISMASHCHSIRLELNAQRSEPSSRTTLIGEQPNLWELLHPQDVVSRHRGAELRRRYELLGGTSLLSLE